MQTKKRAKPVKFGKAAKEQEAKTAVDEAPVVEEVAIPEPQEPAAPAAPVAPAAPPQPHVAATAPQETELVDKLSDVPFETDFTNIPSPTPGTPAAPAAPQPAAPVPEEHAPEEVHADNFQAAPSAFDTNPAAPAASIPPIGRANEPIPFNPHETVFNTPPDAGEKRRNPFLFFTIIALVAFVTGIAFMAGIYYAMPDKNFFAMTGLPGTAEPTPTTAPVAAATPTIAPSKEVKLADYTVKVLNGSGVSGQAAKVKASLTAEGFTVGSTGNAESSDFQKTQITYKKSVSAAALTKIKDVLKKTYVLDKDIELPSSASKESDITITIGKDTVK